MPSRTRRRRRFTRAVGWAAAFSLSGLIAAQVVVVGGHGTVFEVIGGQWDRGPDLDAVKSPSVIRAARVRFGDEIARVTPEFLSVAIDMSQLVGGRWWSPEGDEVAFGPGTAEARPVDLRSRQLDRLTAPLAPAIVAVGGTEADRVHYAPASRALRDTSPPTPYASVLTGGRWDELDDFVRRNGLRLAFTLNGGPSSRGPDGGWDPTNAAALLDHAARGGTPVALWSLANEINGFWIIFGLGATVPVDRYATDLEQLRALVQPRFPTSLVAASSAAFWPVVGEPLERLFPFTRPFLREHGDATDVVGWHYYPQQSRRVPLATRKASPWRMLRPDNLDEAGYWARWIRRLRDEYAPGTPIWLTETGHAQFGGAPGLSDRHLGGLWWIDQLGLLASEGVEVVVRQSLLGLDYGLLDEETLAPRPDYWNSLLWKRLMGERVLDVEVEGGDGDLRAYAHLDENGDVTVALVNLSFDASVRVELPDLEGLGVELWMMDAPDPLGEEIRLNGRPLALDAGGELPPLDGTRLASDGATAVTLEPLSYAFVRGR